MATLCAPDAHSSIQKCAQYAQDFAVRRMHKRHMDTEWFKQRKKALKVNDEKLAEVLGVERSVANKIVNGKVPFNAKKAAAVAELLGETTQEILSRAGIVEDLGSDIPVVGYVGGGAQVYPYDDYAHGDGMDFVERPEYVHGRAVAVEVRGDSMLPTAEDGWKLIYTGDQTINEGDVLNKLCVVKLIDGRMLVKKLLRGSQPQRYHLHSSNAPLIEDVEIEWAARVKSIVPA